MAHLVDTAKHQAVESFEGPAVHVTAPHVYTLFGGPLLEAYKNCSCLKTTQNLNLDDDQLDDLCTSSINSRKSKFLWLSLIRYEKS